MQPYSPSAQLAHDTLRGLDAQGIPTGLFHIMEHSVIERLACAGPGDYRRDPYGVYVRMLENVGVNMVDQMLMENPLSMGERGYEGGGGGATTGGFPEVDGMLIDTPEACAECIERFEIPSVRRSIERFDRRQVMLDAVAGESQGQRIVGPSILKAGYAHLVFPGLLYYRYGYENFLSAWVLFPDLFDRLFKLQADYAALKNQAVVDAFQSAGLPLYHRLDHDMADSRGLLVSLDSLERCWVGQFARSIKPAVDAGFTLLWHCDGNLMELLPCLIEAGVNGFQGFQYEDGMDYVRICRMKDRGGRPLVIQAGVSVTRELPLGKPADVRNQIRFLVENGPRTGLFLSLSSSCTPGTPWENIATAVEGFRYYRSHRPR